METKITVAGIGPGSRDYILPIALKAIENAKVLVGGRRALAQFAAKEQAQIAITADVQGTLAQVERALEKDDVVIMVSGDPGFYSLLPALRVAFPKKKMEVLPGVSSLQLAFARVGAPWQNADLMSLHGRLPDYASLAYEPGRTMGMLTDDEHNSQRIAMLLLDAGWPESTPVYIASHLSYDDEKLVTTTLIRATAQEPVRQCVMAVFG